MHDTQNFYSEFYNFLHKKYPRLSTLNKGPQNFTNVISQKIVEVPTSIIEKAKVAIKNIFTLTHSDTYKPSLEASEKEIFNFKSPNFSTLMAYDFHYLPQKQELKLIEINTNASGFLFVSNLYEFLNIAPLVPKPPEAALMESFYNEIRAFGSQNIKNITIIDDVPEQQKMYSEFVMFQSLFEKHGFLTAIEDPKNLKISAKGLLLPNGEVCGFIYNRYCDFLLQEKRSHHLRTAYLGKLNLFSPNPREYLLLADKRRLVEWTKSEFLDSFSANIDVESIRSVLLKTFPAQSLTKENLWEQKRQFFFKPRQSYGGKSVYRGKSLSRKVFDRLYNENSLIQEYAPPPKLEHENAIWKYDLRFYVYKDQVQNMAARLYQGQVTNFSKPHGGFAALKF